MNELTNAKRLSRETAIEKVLKEPVFLGLDDRASKCKKALVTTSFILLAVKLSGVEIGPSPSIAGISFTGAPQGTIEAILVILMLYFAFQFVWYTVHSFLEWTVRVTGTRHLLPLSTASVITGDDGDFPHDPRNASLYHWWIEKSEAFKRYSESLGNIIEKANSFYEANKTEVNRSAYTQFPQVMYELQQHIQNGKGQLEELSKESLEPRMAVSLRRFDHVFKLLLRQQNLQFLVLDLLLPASLCLAAFLLWCRG